MTTQMGPVSITLPAGIYHTAVQKFEQYGGNLEASLAREPLIAYTILGHCVRDTELEAVTNVTRHEMTADIVANGKQAFTDGGSELLNTFPKLGDDEREVIIKILKKPSRFRRLRRQKAERAEETEVVLQFMVGALDQQLQK